MDIEKGDPVRRILDADVEEVSLVDRAANLRRFLVIKRLEEDEMPNFETDPEVVVQKGDTGKVSEWLQKMAESEDAPKDAIAAVVKLLAEVEKAGAKPEEKKPGEKAKKPEEEEQMKELPADLKTAITDVVSWMKKMSKGPGAPTAAIDRVANFLGKVAGGKYPYPKPGAKAKPNEEPKPGEKKTQKGADGEGEPGEGEPGEGEGQQPAEDNALVVKSDGTMVVNGAALVKGKKFTASRTNALKDMALNVIKLLGEVGDEETMKAIAEAVKALPTSPKFTSGVPAQGTEGVKKGADDDDDKEKAELKKTIADLQKRLADLETARPSPSSIEQDGDDGKTDIEKSFWGGKFLPR